MLEQLEAARDELIGHLPVPDAEVAVVLHGTDTQLLLARPGLAMARRAAHPAGRRLLAGAVGERELHVLSRRRLAERGGDIPGARALLLLTPAALYARLVLAPPVRPRTAHAAARWAWLVAGAAEWLSGQTDHAHGLLARRLREGPRPTLPPGVRDSHLLGGGLVDLLARERGDDAALALSRRLGRGEPGQALVEAFGGRPLRDTEDAWREHLARPARRL